MNTLTALTAATLLSFTPAAHAAGGQSGFIKSLNDIRNVLKIDPAAKTAPGGLGFLPAKFSEPVENPFLEQLNKSRRSIYKMALPSILNIRAGGAIGSGYIIDPDGTALTNYHVIANSLDNISVEMYDGKSYPAKLLAAGPGRDVAIIQIQSEFKDWPALRIGETESLSEGDIVFALGNPVGLGISFSQGAVSRKSQDEASTWVDYVQSDIQISRGNSGGPLLDFAGRIVGMNTAITGTAGKIGLSVKAEDLKRSLAEYRATGKLSDGVGKFGTAELIDIETEEPTVVVVDVPKGGVAEKAGLTLGDSVLSIDGTSMAKGKKNSFIIHSHFGRKKAGETVQFIVRRGIPVELENGAAETAQGILIPGGIVIVSGEHRSFLGSIAMLELDAWISGQTENTGLTPVSITQPGAPAFFRITDKEKRNKGVGKIEIVVVPVEEYTPGSEDEAAQEGEDKEPAPEKKAAN